MIIYIYKDKNISIKYNNLQIINDDGSLNSSIEENCTIDYPDDFQYKNEVEKSSNLSVMNIFLKKSAKIKNML